MPNNDVLWSIGFVVIAAVGALLARKVSRKTNDGKQRARLQDVPKRPLGL
jgi:hypothetical protein